MPIRQGVVKMKTDVMVSIFSNIDIICSIHKDLLSKLEKALEHFPRFSVGRVLLDVVCHQALSARSARTSPSSVFTLTDVCSASYHQCRSTRNM
jgi:hypothetical protein